MISFVDLFILIIQGSSSLDSWTFVDSFRGLLLIFISSGELLGHFGPFFLAF